MAGQQQKVSFLLTGTIDEQQTPELRGPILQQNGSPNLTDSRNTRLSVDRGTCVRMPDITAEGVDLTDGAPAFGIAGGARERDYVLYVTPDQGNRVLADDGTIVRGIGIVRDKMGDGRQNAYLPVQVSRAGALPGVRGTRYPTPLGATYEAWGVSSTYNSVRDEVWCLWDATSTLMGGLSFEAAGRYVSVHTGAGDLLVGPMPLMRHADYPFISGHYALTAHGTDGTRLWFAYAHPVDGLGTYMAPLSVVGNVAVMGTPLRIVEQTGQFGVCSDGGQYAYLAGPSDVVGDGWVVKVDANTGAVVATVYCDDATLATPVAAVSFQTIGGSSYVAAIWGAGGNGYATGIYDQNLAIVNVPARVITNLGANSSPVYAQFLACPVTGLIGAVFAVSSDANVYWQTTVWFQPLVGVAVSVRTLYHSSLYDKGATWRVSETECYPILFTGKNYGTLLNGVPSETITLLDPALIGYILGPTATTDVLNVTPIIRLGCVRGVQSPVFIQASLWRAPGNGLSFIGNELFVPYKKADGETTGRYACVSFVAEQPSVVNDRDGPALIAAALPAQWDGVETVEYGGPLHAPILQVFDDGILSPLPVGNYGFTATYEWTDQAGMFHRSMPCPTISVSFNGTTEICRVRASLPDSMRNARQQEPIRVVLYMTSANGTAYRALPFEYRIEAPFVEMEVGSAPSEYSPIIYSRGLEGEEIVPQPPPPLRDITIVGSRCWGIDAEIPTRLVYSKLRVAGIGFEFFPAGEVIVPSSAGDVTALREQSGTLIVFAARGIYQISDGGPNNLGQGGSFGSPYKLSDAGTSQRRSVINTPAGILFLDNAGLFSVLRAGVVTSLPGALVTDPVIGAYLLEDAEECVVVVGSTAKVFNYALARWTTWDLPQAPSLVLQSALTRNTGLMFAPANARTYTVLSSRISATALMRWETDWILLGGDFQDYVVLYDVLFNGYLLSPHGVRFEVLTEYDGVTATTSREWTDLELAALIGPTGRYTIRLDPVRQDARAIKIRIQELTQSGDHRGLRPGAVTIIYSIDGLTYEESNIPGSHK